MKMEHHTGSEFGSYAKHGEEGHTAHGDIKKPRSRLDLSGEWEVTLEGSPVAYPIHLPGTLDGENIGPENPMRTLDHLARKRKYIGKACYRKTIRIPEEFENRHVELSFDRCLWKSTVYMDGAFVGSCDSLSTPHTYDVTAFCSAGFHELLIEVDNRQRSGASCHGYGEEEQTVWNGILGEFIMTASDKIYIEAVRIYPDIQHNRVSVEVGVCNGLLCDELTRLEAAVIQNGEVIGTAVSKIELCSRRADVILLVDLIKPAQLWDEFSPHLCRL